MPAALHTHLNHKHARAQTHTHARTRPEGATRRTPHAFFINLSCNTQCVARHTRAWSTKGRNVTRCIPCTVHPPLRERVDRDSGDHSQLPTNAKVPARAQQRAIRYRGAIRGKCRAASDGAPCDPFVVVAQTLPMGAHSCTLTRKRTERERDTMQVGLATHVWWRRSASTSSSWSVTTIEREITFGIAPLPPCPQLRLFVLTALAPCRPSKTRNQVLGAHTHKNTRARALGAGLRVQSQTPFRSERALSLTRAAERLRNGGGPLRGGTRGSGRGCAAGRSSRT